MVVRKILTGKLGVSQAKQTIFEVFPERKVKEGVVAVWSPEAQTEGKDQAAPNDGDKRQGTD